MDQQNQSHDEPTAADIAAGVASFKATIAFGLIAIAMLWGTAAVFGHVGGMITATAAAGLSYGAQSTYTLDNSLAPSLQTGAIVMACLSAVLTLMGV